MDILKIFDAYSSRARLFPAIIAVAPAIAALALLISWKSFELSNLVASTAILVLLFAIADLARARGRQIEIELYKEHGGMPSITLFRRSDTTIANSIKGRYGSFMATKVGLPYPSEQEELNDQGAADSFYEHCGVWLRQNTRDTKKFPILFNENITYGFRRNLLGVKWLGLMLNALVVGFCLYMLWRESWNLDAPLGKRAIVVLLVALAHAAYMLIAVSRAAVWDASRAYGRELILSCEAFVCMQKAPRSATSRKNQSQPAVDKSDIK